MNRKTIAIFLIAFLFLAVLPFRQAQASFSFSRTITIDHTKVGSTDSTNFPVLVSGTYSYLATVANGGKVTNSSGYDVIFTSDSACATKLNWETETYTAASGLVNYWVQVPTVSHTTDTVIYMCYGNSSITTDQSNKTGTWNDGGSNYYKFVYHFGDGTTLSLNDSTSNARNATDVGSTASAASGAFSHGGAMALTGASGQSVTMGSGAVLATHSAWTIFASIKSNLAPSDNGYAIYSERGSSGNDILKMDWVQSNSGHSHSVSVTLRDDAGTLIQSGSLTVAVINDNAWHRAAMILSGGVVSVYIDGAFDHSMAWSGTTNFTDATLAPWIGSDKGDPNARFTNTIDELSGSIVARSADWITADYNNQSSPSTFYTVGAEQNIGGGGISAFIPRLSLNSQLILQSQMILN